MLHSNCNFIRKKIARVKKNFLPEVKIKRQILDLYIKDKCKFKSYYGIITTEISSPKSNHIRHQIQTDDINIDFLKSFTDCIRVTQHQNAQRANSVFTNDVFSIIYSYLSILEIRETQSESPAQTSRHKTGRQEICIFSKFLNTIRGNLTSNEISQKVEHDLQKILAWFIIDYFVHNIDLMSLAGKKF